MYCMHCGKEIPNDSTFCLHCGKTQTEIKSAQPFVHQPVTYQRQIRSETNLVDSSKPNHPFEQEYFFRIAHNNISLMYTSVIIESKNPFGKVLVRNDFDVSDLIGIELVKPNPFTVGTLRFFINQDGIQKKLTASFEPWSKKKINKLISVLTSHTGVQAKTVSAKKRIVSKRAIALYLCAILLVLFLIPTSSNSKPTVSDSTSNPYVSDSLTETSKQTEKPTEATTEGTTVDSKTAREAYIQSCSIIDYKTLARNPDKYKGNRYKFTGEVIQVIETYGLVELRVNITKNEYDYYSDTIYVTLYVGNDGDRILEDDIITIYGECAGLYTYTALLGQEVTLPKIQGKYYTIK